MKQVWIRFCDEGKSDSGKTSRFSVRAKDGGALLGEVRWFGRWRKYAFFPEELAVFEQDCLRTIADFCEAQSKEHRGQPHVEVGA